MNFSLWRALIPSWKFFDRVGTQLYLETRNAPSAEWQDALPAPTSGAFTLFLNHRRNVHLAYFSILERFVEEAQSLRSASEIRALVTHDLLRNIALREFDKGRGQFRILAAEEDGKQHEIFISEFFGGS